MEQQVQLLQRAKGSVQMRRLFLQMPTKHQKQALVIGFV